MAGMGRDGGYSLIEVLITLAVLGIFLVPLPALFLQSFLSTQLAGQKTAAAALAQDRLEVCRADGFTYILEEVLTEERDASSFHPYVQGRANYFSSTGEEGGMNWHSEIHLLKLEVDGFEPGNTEILLLEVCITWLDTGERCFYLASYLSGGR